MVSFAQAKALALKCWSEVNYCQETEKVFIFSKSDDFSFGGNSPVVVVKETGRCINMLAYIDAFPEDKTIREAPLAEFKA